MADVKFEPDNAGIVEIFTSSGMQAALKDVADKICASANLVANPHNAHVSKFEAPPYAAHVDVLDKTAVGAVRTNGAIGCIHERTTHTLNRFCH